jgi:hypothetical protein
MDKTFFRHISATLLLIGLSFAFFPLVKSCNYITTFNKADIYKTSISTIANSWISGKNETPASIIPDEGIINWKSETDTLCTYFWTTGKGEVKIGLHIEKLEAKVKLAVQLGNTTRNITLKPNENDSTYVGKFQLPDSGYHTIKIYGIKKKGTHYPNIKAILLGGNTINKNTVFIKDDVYWGRRGASVHLSYPIPESFGNIKCFYNEIRVEEGNDVIGSYFMANGFGEGYFGIQVNSKSERRVLFSVWSPFNTDDPNKIPEDKKIILNNKGENVYTGEFGNEGSGGQSFLKYNWKTGVNYGFLLKGVPNKNNSTTYTAWFFDPENAEWMLIASFTRPATSTYLTHLYSFIENFYTETGCFKREAKFMNQWIMNTQGDWLELTEAKFTADATARKKSRLDYAGGKNKGYFWLKNCGFFSCPTPIGSKFTREKTNRFPIWGALRIAKQ